MTEDDTPPGPIFQGSIAPHQARFQHQTTRFRRAVDKIFPTTICMGSTLLLMRSTGALKVGLGCVLSSVTFGRLLPSTTFPDSEGTDVLGFRLTPRMYMGASKLRLIISLFRGSNPVLCIEARFVLLRVLFSGRHQMRLREIKHGRLAMAAFAFHYAGVLLEKKGVVVGHQLWGSVCVYNLKWGLSSLPPPICYPRPEAALDTTLSWEIMYRVLSGFFKEPYY